MGCRRHQSEDHGPAILLRITDRPSLVSLRPCPREGSAFLISRQTLDVRQTMDIITAAADLIVVIFPDRDGDGGGLWGLRPFFLLFRFKNFNFLAVRLEKQQSSVFFHWQTETVTSVGVAHLRCSC